MQEAKEQLPETRQEEHDGFLTPVWFSPFGTALQVGYDASWTPCPASRPASRYSYEYYITRWQFGEMRESFVLLAIQCRTVSEREEGREWNKRAYFEEVGAPSQEAQREGHFCGEDGGGAGGT